MPADRPNAVICRRMLNDLFSNEMQTDAKIAAAAEEEVVAVVLP